MTRHTLIDLNTDHQNQGSRYYPYRFNKRCNRRYNTFDYTSGRVSVPNKTKNINLNESKT